MREELGKIKTALHLMNSMILSGEEHSAASTLALTQAALAIEQLEARPEAAQVRCAECTCERGGDDCDWIKSKPDTVTGWQDISTAPKDGTEILLWLRDCMTIAYWYEHDSCWLECSGEIWQEWQVTAWMPLPPAPEKEK